MRGGCREALPGRGQKVNGDQGPLEQSGESGSSEPRGVKDSELRGGKRGQEGEGVMSGFCLFSCSLKRSLSAEFVFGYEEQRGLERVVDR
jgi:hypothetical protein